MEYTRQEFTGNLVPVSYTHLDVYKRQEIGKAVGEYVANVLHGHGDVVEISGLVGSTPAVDPVSYTHLDNSLGGSLN